MTADQPELSPRARLRQLLTLDLQPLRRREFRLLFIGRAVSLFGSTITMVALPFQVYHLTGSSLDVGLLGLFEIVPILLLAIFAGAAADAWDRRRMVLLTEASMSLVLVALIVNGTRPNPQVWVLFAAAAVFAALDALQGPSLSAILPRLVPPDELAAATAITTFYQAPAQIVGPAVAGIIIATAGVTDAYVVDALTFLLGLIALTLMRAVPPPADAERPSVRRIIEGLRYARSRPELLGTYLVDIVAMFFGMPMALFPALAVRLGGPSVLGALMAAPAVGSLLAAVSSGWTRHIRYQGRAVIFAATGWGLAIVLFGLSPNLPPALVFLALAGGADEFSAIFRSTIWNQTIPDHLRGRLAGIEMISYTVGPAFGNLEAGVAGTLLSLPAAIVSGGVLCVAGTTSLAFALPRLWSYEASESRGENAA